MVTKKDVGLTLFYTHLASCMYLPMLISPRYVHLALCPPSPVPVPNLPLFQVILRDPF